MYINNGISLKAQLDLRALLRAFSLHGVKTSDNSACKSILYL